MKFGVMLPHFRHLASPQNIRRVAEAAEGLGYDSIWISDHIVIPNPYVERFGAVFYEALVVLAYVAAVTRKARLGTSVLILPYRHPLLLAKQAATLDHLSGGRLILGAAAGWCQEEFESLGVPFGERGERSDETLKGLLAAWSQEEPAFEGRFFRFRGAKALPHPLQRPRPPLWVGGNSRRAQRRAVELGDAWHPTRPSPQDILTGRENIRRLAERRGRSLDGFVIAARHPMKVTDSPLESQWPLIGTADQVSKGLEAFQKAGAEHFVLDTFYSAPELYGETVEDVLRTLERFAQRVARRFG